MTVRAEQTKGGPRIESRDDDGTTEPLTALVWVSACSTCGKTWPTRFGRGAPTVRIVPTEGR